MSAEENSELRTQNSELRTFPPLQTGALTVAKADLRTFYRDAHAVTCLSDREKMLMGLAVAMMRLCDP